MPWLRGGDTAKYRYKTGTDCYEGNLSADRRGAICRSYYGNSEGADKRLQKVNDSYHLTMPTGIIAIIDKAGGYTSYRDHGGIMQDMPRRGLSEDCDSYLVEVSGIKDNHLLTN